MRVLLDHNIPIQLAKLLPGHEVTTARAIGWDLLENGDLLKAAEQAQFAVMVTADTSIFYQQNNLLRQVGLVVVSTNYRPALERSAAAILAAISRASPGSFESVIIAGADRRSRQR